MQSGGEKSHGHAVAPMLKVPRWVGVIHGDHGWWMGGEELVMVGGSIKNAKKCIKSCFFLKIKSKKGSPPLFKVSFNFTV